MESEGIVSMIIYPIYRNREMIGFIGFDYCEFKYKWTMSKYEYLKTVLGIISRIYDKAHREKLETESNEKLKNIKKAFSYGKWEWNINTGELAINERYAKILGYELKELQNLTIDDWKNFVEVSDLEKSSKLIEEYVRGEIESYTCEIHIRHKSGRLIKVIHKGKIINWNRDGSLKKMVGTIYDNKLIKETEVDKLKYLMAIEQATISFIMTDSKGIIEYVNPAYEKSSGYLLEDVVGEYTNFFESELNSKELKEELMEVTKNGKTWEGELVSKKKDGSIYYEEVRITPVINQQDEIINYISIKQDISKRKILEKKLREVSIRDDLTNIYNRGYVFERLKEISEAYKRKKQVFSIAILDIDYLKKINDTYGHPGGDFILKEFARLLSEKIRTTDILGRYGGEEFIIIFMDSNKEDSKIVVDRIRKSVENKTFVYKGNQINFTFSGGVSDAYESDISKFSFEYLINEADKRLYKAKEGGRNKVM